jgi:hypothetical protein
MRATRCQKCNNRSLTERDGREVGGMPGVKYQCCDACGWSRAITKAGSQRAKVSPAVRELANSLGIDLEATNAQAAFVDCRGGPADLDATLEQIATRTLGIPTLETRRSDRLDFHDLAVWQIKDALRAAYDAGRASR